MPQQYHVMSHVEKMNNFTDTMSIPLAPLELVAIGAFVWSLLGLWLWLNFDENDCGSGPFFRLMFTFFCGPSAWITATWKATHRPPRPRGEPPMKAEQWMWPKNWKN
jgi:hypothetical protein